MGHVKLNCFGVGDGEACGDRNHSSYLYRLGDCGLLLDCGEPISKSYKASGLSYEAVDRILISHLHFDHIGGLFMLLQGFWLEERKKDLIVHLPAEGIEPIERLLRAGYLFEELLTFRLRFEALTAEQTLEVEGVRVTPFPTTHLDHFKKSFGAKYQQDFAAYSFLLEAEGVRIGHSADVGAPEDLEPLLRKPLDLLVCELAHFKREALFNYLKGRDIGQVVFVHVGRPYWEKLKETKELALRLLPGMKTRFARDLEEIKL